jgi:MFS family permease
MKHSYIAKHRKLFGTFIFILAALFLSFEMILQVSPSIMTNQLMAEFNINAAVLGIIASFYFYSYAAMQIPSGLLYDRFGPRILITIATTLCSLGALFFGLTHSVFLLAVGRFLLGIGSAFAFVGALTVAARWFAPSLFALFIGLVQFIGAIGATCGAYPLAYVINTFGWRSTMTALGYIGLGLALLCAIFIRNRPPQDEDKISDHHTHLGFMKSFKTVICQGQSWNLGLFSFTNWAPMLMIPALWGVPYLMGKYNLPTTTAAFANSMAWIGMGLFSPFLGWLSDKIQRRTILLSATSLLGLLASAILLFVPNLHYTVICLILFLIGCASSGNLLCFAVAKDINRPSVTSTAMGFNNMTVVLSGVVFQPIVGWILLKFWEGGMENGAPLYTTYSYTWALTMVPVCYFIGLLVSIFMIKETFCKHTFDAYSDQLQ